MSTLRAFHNDPAIKRTYLARVRAHAKADEIIHGTYWEHGKGCAVGCTIHSDKHVHYETELGIPRILAQLEDRLFEGMANGTAKIFPARFLAAIPVGADLWPVWYQFAHWLLLDTQHGVIRFAKNDQSKEAIQRVGEYCLKTAQGQSIIQADWQAAADAAVADAAAADAAAYAANAARRKHYRKMADRLCALLTLAPIPSAGHTSEG